MYTFKIVTITFDVIMMSMIFFFMRGLNREEDKATKVGFSAMQILYLMNMLCMWW